MSSHKSIRLLLASGLGAGLIPFGPGTWATLLGLAIHAGCVMGIPGPEWRWWMLVWLAAVSAIHFWLTPWAQTYWGNEDPKQFVLDEIAGYLIVPILLPREPFWPTAIWSFLLFRAYDIAKLPGARYFDRHWHDAWGILLDDLISGVYAAATIWLSRWLLAG